MITLYTFGPGFRLPDPSPFVIKALVLLKMSGLEYETKPANFKNAPTGKVPYMKDGDQIIGDSTFIRFHLEDNHGIDFDKGLTEEQKAIAWAFEKMCEDHLYFATLKDRWLDDTNFKLGPEKFFKAVPAIVRPIVTSRVRARIKKTLYLHGIGRHSDENINRLSQRALKSISDYLGEKSFFFGDKPCGADAIIFAAVASVLCTRFDSVSRDNAEKFENLKAYNDRCMKLWFPEIAAKA